MPCHGVQWHDVAWLCLGIDGRTLPWLGMAFSDMVVLFVVTVDRSVAVCLDAVLGVVVCLGDRQWWSAWQLLAPRGPRCWLGVGWLVDYWLGV